MRKRKLSRNCLCIHTDQHVLLSHNSFAPPQFEIKCTFVPLQALEPHRNERSNGAIQAQTCWTDSSLFAIANSPLCLGFSAPSALNWKMKHLNFDSYGGFSEFRFRYL